MSATTISSRELNQDVSNAKRQSATGPVIITDRGTPAHVLMTMAHYRQLTENQPSIVDLLAMPQTDIEFEPQPVTSQLFKAADLT